MEEASDWTLVPNPEWIVALMVTFGRPDGHDNQVDYFRQFGSHQIKTSRGFGRGTAIRWAAILRQSWEINSSVLVWLSPMRRGRRLKASCQAL